MIYKFSYYFNKKKIFAILQRRNVAMIVCYLFIIIEMIKVCLHICLKYELFLIKTLVCVKEIDKY